MDSLPSHLSNWRVTSREWREKPFSKTVKIGGLGPGGVDLLASPYYERDCEPFRGTESPNPQPQSSNLRLLTWTAFLPGRLWINCFIHLNEHSVVSGSSILVRSFLTHLVRCIYIYISKSVWVCDYMQEIWRNTPRKTNMTLEKQQFEDVSPIENGDVPLTRWFSAGYHYLPCIWDCHLTYNLHNSTSHLWLLLGMPNCLNQNLFYVLVCLVTWYFSISLAVFHSFDILFLSVSMFRYAQAWMLFDIPLVST